MYIQMPPTNFRIALCYLLTASRALAWSLAAVLTSCGGGNSSSNSTASESTSAISSYFSAHYAQAQTQLALDSNATLRQLASQGYLCSGNQASAMLQIKTSSISTFTADAVAYVRSTAQSGKALDKLSITSLMDSYLNQDLLWLSNPTSALGGNCGWPAALLSTLQTQLAQAANNSYATAAAQIGAL